MPSRKPASSLNASTLQEAIDTVVQQFDHPPEIELRYSAENAQKETEIAVDGQRFRLRCTNTEEDADPVLDRVDSL